MAKPITPSDLPEDLARFAEAQVAAGRFASIEDVLRAGQKARERQQRNEAKLAALDAALEEGERSGIADDYSLQGTLAKLGLGQAAR
jgi:antitoxin ParD1/3/4